MRDSFVFYRSYAEALQELPDDIRLKIMDAVLQYALDGQEPDLSGVEKAVFVLMRPQIDANNQRYENGKKGGESGARGGRPPKNKPQENPEITPKKPQENPTETPNVNVNVNVNANVNEETVPRAGAREDTDEIASDYLTFMREHAEIQEDLKNPSEIASIDFSLLSRKIAESSFLQTRNSLAWLIGNYPKIISDSYKDFRRSRASPDEKPAGRFAKSTKAQLDSAFGEGT